jgi:hypothetical protein
MKRNVAAAVAMLVSLGLAGVAVAQARHDEKPHGYDKAKADAAATDTTNAGTPSGAGGRHDEKPHGVKKAKTAAKDAPKSADPKPVAPPATPEAKKAVP